MTFPVKLSELQRCFQGVTPSLIATVDGRGVPNVTYVSQVYYVDEQHVALSCQFFNKTRRNLDENPRACVEMYDPLTMQAYRLRLKFIRSEKHGALFDTMSARIEAIASATGMKGIFRLIAADVFDVVSVERVEGFLVEDRPAIEAEAPTLAGHRSEVRGLQWVSERINRACDLESLLDAALQALDEYFQFAHTSVLLHDEPCGRLTTLASRGYGARGIGAADGNSPRISRNPAPSLSAPAGSMPTASQPAAAASRTKRPPPEPTSRHRPPPDGASSASRLVKSARRPSSMASAVPSASVPS